MVFTRPGNDKSGEVRFCSGCEKEVYESINDDNLLDNIHLNRCIAITSEGETEEWARSSQ